MISRWYQYAYTLYGNRIYLLATTSLISIVNRCKLDRRQHRGKSWRALHFRVSRLLSSRPLAIERSGRPRKMTIYRLHCHSIVGCEESPVTAVGAAGLPAGSFVSATGICVFGIRRRPIVLPRNDPIRLQISPAQLSIARQILSCLFLTLKKDKKHFFSLIYRLYEEEIFACESGENMRYITTTSSDDDNDNAMIK